MKILYKTIKNHENRSQRHQSGTYPTATATTHAVGPFLYGKRVSASQFNHFTPFYTYLSYFEPQMVILESKWEIIGPGKCRIFLPTTVGKKGPFGVRFRNKYASPPAPAPLFLSVGAPLPTHARGPKRASGLLP